MQSHGMNRKADKVEETAAPYAAKSAEKTAVPAKNTDSGVKFADLKDVRTQNERLMKVHQKVLQKLAQ